uniref:BED-type domain-containing protein n=1 Tax=Bursaphelenchus xylophilus TaxID=6326 RepID=A0A1I7SI58_BURXY
MVSKYAIYFEKRDGRFWCKTCNWSVEYKPKGTTTPLTRHLQRFHKKCLISRKTDSWQQTDESWNIAENENDTATAHITAQQILGGFLNNELLQMIKPEIETELAQQLLPELAIAAKLVLVSLVSFRNGKEFLLS